MLELIDSSPERRSGGTVTPKITQSRLAVMIGVSRENANRALAALARDGSVRLEDGRYVLVDEERLRREVAQGWPLAARWVRRIDIPSPSVSRCVPWESATEVGSRGRPVGCALRRAYVPLAGYFISPDATDAAVRRFKDFLSRDGHRILLIAGTLVGLLLLARGIIRLA